MLSQCPRFEPYMGDHICMWIATDSVVYLRLFCFYLVNHVFIDQWFVKTPKLYIVYTVYWIYMILYEDFVLYFIVLQFDQLFINPSH